MTLRNNFIAYSEPSRLDMMWAGWSIAELVAVGAQNPKPLSLNPQPGTLIRVPKPQTLLEGAGDLVSRL